MRKQKKGIKLNFLPLSTTWSAT